MQIVFCKFTNNWCVYTEANACELHSCSACDLWYFYNLWLPIKRFLLSQEYNEQSYGNENNSVKSIYWTPIPWCLKYNVFSHACASRAFYLIAFPFTSILKVCVQQSSAMYTEKYGTRTYKHLREALIAETDWHFNIRSVYLIRKVLYSISK